MAQRAHGFLQKAKPLIEQQPGMTSQEVAAYLLGTGQAHSEAREPVLSLANTLNKHFRDIQVTRSKDGGVYRYYPEGMQSETKREKSASEPQRVLDVSIQLRIPQSIADVTDALVAVDRFQTRNDALIWLLGKGVASLRR